MSNAEDFIIIGCQFEGSPKIYFYRFYDRTPFVNEVIRTPTGFAKVAYIVPKVPARAAFRSGGEDRDPAPALASASDSQRRGEILTRLAALQTAQDLADKYLALAKKNPEAKKLIAEYKKLSTKGPSL